MKPSQVPNDVRVLVVDDNHDAAESLSELLTVLECQTALAFDGPAAMAACGRFCPHIAFIDLDMPGMDGCEVARRLKETGMASSLWLICLTGRSAGQAEQRCMEAGFDRFITKPIDPDALIDALDLAKAH